MKLVEVAKRVYQYRDHFEVAGRQAEPHTHMGNKRKPMSWFSHGYHG